jgi:phage shock protein A
MGDSRAQMARRKNTPQRLPDAVRDAVERTVQATLGGAEQTRGRAQEALDDVVSGAEQSAKTVRARVRKTVEATRPATGEDIRALRREIRALAKRVDELEGKSSTAKAKPKAKPRRSTSSSGTKRPGGTRSTRRSS